MQNRKSARVMVLGGTFLMGQLEDGLYYPVFTLHDILLADQALRCFEAWRTQRHDPDVIAHIEQRYAEMTGQLMPNVLPDSLDERKLQAMEDWILGEGCPQTMTPPGILRQTFTREWHRTEEGEHIAAKHFGEYLLQADRYAVAHLLGIAAKPELTPRWGGHVHGQMALQQAVQHMFQQQLQDYDLQGEVLLPLQSMVDSLNMTDATQPNATGAGHIRALIRAVRAALDRGEYPIIIGGTDTLEWYATAVATALQPYWSEHAVLFVSAMQGFGQNPRHVVGLWRAALQVRSRGGVGCQVLVANDASVTEWTVLDACRPFLKISADARCWQSFKAASEHGVAQEGQTIHDTQQEDREWQKIFPPVHASTPVRQVIGWLQTLSYRQAGASATNRWDAVLLAGIPGEARKHEGLASALLAAMAQLVQHGVQLWVCNPYQAVEPLWESSLQPSMLVEEEQLWREKVEAIGGKWLGCQTVPHAYWQACWHGDDGNMNVPQAMASATVSYRDDEIKPLLLPVVWERLAIYAVPLEDVMVEAMHELLRIYSLRQLAVIAAPGGVLPEKLATRLREQWKEWQPLANTLQVTTLHAGLWHNMSHSSREETCWDETAVYAPVRIWRKQPFVCSRGQESIADIMQG